MEILPFSPRKCPKILNQIGEVWYHKIIDKILQKHHVRREEVEEVFARKPRFTFLEKGKVKAEHLYAARGRTAAGNTVDLSPGDQSPGSKPKQAKAS